MEHRDEHQRNLLVRVDDDVLWLQHQGTRDQHTHRHDTAEAHSQVGGDAIHPEFLFGQLLLDAARRVEVEQIRTYGRADDADGNEAYCAGSC